MAIISGFFDSVNGDRKYDSSFLAEFFGALIGNGVFPNPSTGLQVVASQNMQTVVKPGKGWIEGRYIRNNSDYVLQHDVADGILKRIDRVVMRKNLLTRQNDIVIKKGTPASNPVAPTLQRDTDYFELALADVYINNGATVITQANITDQRFNTQLCGIVKGTVEQIDTTNLFAQYQDAFETWFEELDVILDGNVAANLANQIAQHTSQNDNLTKHKANQISIAPISGMTATNVQEAIAANFTQVVNGKNLIAAAINDREGSASGSDSFEELAMSISTLPSGKKFATGTANTDPNSLMFFQYYSGAATVATNFLRVTGLDFKPSLIIISRPNNTLNGSRMVQYFENLGGNQDYVMQIIPQQGESTDSNVVVGFKGNTGSSYVNDTGFCLPYGAGDVNVIWQAFE